MLATIGAGTDAKTALKAAAEKAVAATLVTTAGTVTDAGAVTTLEVADAGEWRSAMDRGHHSNYVNHKRSSNVA